MSNREWRETKQQPRRAISCVGGLSYSVIVSDMLCKCLQGYSPIHPAAWRNDLKVIKMCEKAGADMDHITKTGWSTLTCSLKNDKGPAMGGDLAHIEPTMEYLLEKGANIGWYFTGLVLRMLCNKWR